MKQQIAGMGEKRKQRRWQMHEDGRDPEAYNLNHLFYS
jgi:hypothetical protein